MKSRAVESSRVPRSLVSSFILFHMLAFAAWTIPVKVAPLNWLNRLTRPYLLFTGLFQAWDMFAPDPMRLNGYLTAEIVFRDGRTTEWTAPRMERLGPVRQYFRERYRKFMNEHVWMDAQPALWPDTARHLARLYADRNNPPVYVILVRHWSQILPPGPHGEFRAMPWSQYAYYSYDVQPEDLQ